MVVIIQQVQQEDLDAEDPKKGRATKMLRILNAITCLAHWIYGIPKIMLELVEVQPLGPQEVV